MGSEMYFKGNKIVSRDLNGRVIISTSDWNTDDTIYYEKYCDIPVPEVTQKDRADVIIIPEDEGIIEDCSFCPVSETFDGKIRIRSVKVPTINIVVEYWIEKG